jgi:hypothetical protein
MGSRATAVNRTRTSTLLRLESLEGWNPNHWTTEAFVYNKLSNRIIIEQNAGLCTDDHYAVTMV